MSRYQELGIARPEQFFVQKDILPAVSILQQNMANRSAKRERAAEREEDRFRDDVLRVGKMFEEVPDPKTESDIAYNQEVAKARERGIEIVRTIKDPVAQMQALAKENTNINRVKNEYAARNLKMAAVADQVGSFGAEYVDQDAAAAEIKKSVYNAEKQEDGTVKLVPKGPQYDFSDLNPEDIAAKHFKTDDFISDQIKKFGETTGLKVSRIDGQNYLEVSQGSFVDANGNITIPDSAIDGMFQDPAGALFEKRLLGRLPDSLKGPNADPAKIRMAVRDAARKELKQRVSQSKSYQRIVKDDSGEIRKPTITEQRQMQEDFDRVSNVAVIMQALNNGVETLTEEGVNRLEVALGSLSGAKIPIKTSESGSQEPLELRIERKRPINSVASKAKKVGDVYQYSYTDPATGITTTASGKTPEEAYEKAVPEKPMLVYLRGDKWVPLEVTRSMISESSLNNLYNRGNERDIDFNRYTRARGAYYDQAAQRFFRGSSAAPSADPNNPLGIRLGQ